MPSPTARYCSLTPPSASRASWSGTPGTRSPAQAALQAELAAVRRDGYATAIAELEDELVAVAAPVFDGTGACVAALSISGPAYRMPPDRLAEFGKLCADQAERPAHG